MSNSNDLFSNLTRRDFLIAGVGGAASLLLPTNLIFGAVGEIKKTDVWVFHGENKSNLMIACLKQIDKSGGLGKNVKKLTLKVNGAWNSSPKRGGNTHPELVEAFLKGCKQRGVKELVMPEHSCNPAKQSFPKSGLLAASKAGSAKMIDLKNNTHMFKDIKIPKAKVLKTAQVARDFLETDALVNMPVAKHHGTTKFTCAMKNWMGAVQDRGFWHRNDLHQCIADFNTFIKPQWTIIDATRIMLDSGPAGPTKNMKIPNLIILSRDPVAADAWASQLLLPEGPKGVKYLRIAGEMKIGTVDLKQMAIHKIEVS